MFPLGSFGTESWKKYEGIVPQYQAVSTGGPCLDIKQADVGTVVTCVHRSTDIFVPGLSFM